MNSSVFTMFFLVFSFTTTSLATKQFEVSSSWSRQLGFCCGSVATKCAQGCARKNCDVQCSGTCGPDSLDSAVAQWPQNVLRAVQGRTVMSSAVEPVVQTAWILLWLSGHKMCSGLCKEEL